MLVLVRWPRLAGVLLVLMAFELAWGAGLFALQQAGLAAALADAAGQVRAAALPMASAAAGRADPLAQAHQLDGACDPATPREGTRGRIPSRQPRGAGPSSPPSAARRPTISARAKATPGPIAWLSAGGDRYFVVNHGVPGYTTAEHLIQTAFYQTKFGKPPRCAIYYVGWNDLRNAHIARLDPGYADFHLPSQVDLQKVRRVGGSHVTLSPLLTRADALRGRQPSTRCATSPIRYGQPAGERRRSRSRCALSSATSRSISAINRQRGVTTIWVGQLLNRERLKGDGRYGWLPLVRDRDPLADAAEV